MYLVIVLLALALYSPLYGAGFVTDFLGWLDCRQDTHFFASHLCFQNRGLYYIPFLFLTVLTDLFGTHPLPWYVIFTGLHALNACLVASLLRALSRYFQVAVPAWVPLVAALCFLLVPYQVEVVAWKACINYLTTGAMLLATVQLYLKWWADGRRKWIGMTIGLYVISLFNLEFVLLLPVLLTGLHLLTPGEQRGSLRRVVSGVGPLYVVAILFLVINILVMGKAVGHYETELGTFNPLSLASAELKYAFKILFFGRLWPYPTQHLIYTALSSTLAGALSFAA
ncbi:MAG: hypothetical protein R3330_05500, partial [Saprospiraceae bacterium]|nr:hypothetical protein [Saprospiraceae bacterium]